MAVITALEQLFADVVERFDDETTDVPNVFGWREPARRGAQQNRICWVPGDPSGGAGDITGARQPGRNPRPLATLNELFSVYIEGRDATDPENEQAQYHATRLLLDAWYRAVYLSARTLIDVKSASWLVDRTTRRHGATLRLICTVQAMIPDAPLAAADLDDAVLGLELDADADETTSTSESLTAPPLEET